MLIFTQLTSEQTNQRIPFEVSKNEFVKKIRQKASKEYKVRESEIRIFFRGREMDDNDILFHYSVKDNDTLIVMKKPLLEIDQNVESVENVLKLEAIGTVLSESVSIKTAEEAYEELCKECKKKPERACEECGCHICGGKEDEDRTLTCDECQFYYHMKCQDPPLETIPEGDWFCNSCFNDPSVVITLGTDWEKTSKAKMHSATQKKQWGRGNACSGVIEKCTIVPSTHIGAIPGVPVGTTWVYRKEVSASGVHRPPVSGIAGREKTGAVSIVVSGGYPEDEDDGDEITYTGSGGRDLKSGNRRVAEQTFDQTLTKMNLTLAKTCDAKVNNTDGAEASDWRKSRPIRVVRKHNKKSKYAPESGLRYDGLYKLVKYWPERCGNKFLVWRFLFRRDDTEPAPWTKAGNKRILELGLGSDNTKRRKFLISDETKKLIAADKQNSSAWESILAADYTDLHQFVNSLTKGTFSCSICLELVKDPVTLECAHNICLLCHDSHRKHYAFCPLCRKELGSNVELLLEGIKALKTQLRAKNNIRVPVPKAEIVAD